jgi:predicted NAD-dependent protein-ADP-ribosyltransferase YbiA (DUF1768 family)
MDIGSGAGYPASALSNFAPHPFIMDGVMINSMEGFLQSLKFDKFEQQVEVCQLVGFRAKMRGKNKSWWRHQTLYWQGVEYARKSEQYQLLLDRAYLAMFKQNTGFRAALLSTKDVVLTHSIGKTHQNETVLTQQEFCSRLMRLRICLIRDSSF